MTSKPYFHELSQEQKQSARNVGVEGLLEKYAQPDWCFYPEALAGNLGCRSLIGGLIDSKEECVGCEFCRE
ncbi:MAG TPA: hypothetical protein V6C63_01085 [Allocoleopsis sp.]